MAAETALAETEALNCPRPAHTLSLLGRTLRSECRRSQDHTVTLDQECVKRLYQLANRASEQEKQRRQLKQKSEGHERSGEGWQRPAGRLREGMQTGSPIASARGEDITR
jgi:hypothetical protein